MADDRTSHAAPAPPASFPWRRLLRIGAAVALISAAVVTVAPSPAGADTPHFFSADGPCGATQTTVVPAGIHRVMLQAGGGAGGAGGGQGGGQGGPAGQGAFGIAYLDVAPGTTISMIVGCEGADGSAAPNSDPTAGWSTGGGAGIGSTTAFEGGASGGAGGGATGICVGSATCTPSSSSLVIVAGGGGGGGTTNCAPHDESASTGGDGGGALQPETTAGGGTGPTGHDGSSSNGAGGAGGVTSSGGSAAGETSANGSGGLGVNVVGGGGGGGYVGGAAGSGASFGCVGGGGGGGGSSWLRGAEHLSTSFSTTRMSGAGMATVHFLRETTTTVTSSANPSVLGDWVTITATVVDDVEGEPAPNGYGSVTFREGGDVLVSGVSVNASGQATYSTSSLTLGSHTITADYHGASHLLDSSGQIVQVVSETPPPPPPDEVTSTQVQSSLNPSVAGDLVTFTVTVLDSELDPVTAGTVEITASGAVLAAAMPLDASGQASTATSTLAVGTHEVVATYSGADGIASSHADLDQLVEPVEGPPATDPPSDPPPTDPPPSDPGPTDPSPSPADPTSPPSPSAGGPVVGSARGARSAGSGSAGRLPVTGFDVAGVLLVGLGLAAAGRASLAASRRRSAR